MTSANKPQTTTDELDDSEIAAYLQAHPDFFERHDALLDKLRIPHRSGSAVSLVERQVATLRQKNLKLERNLRDLVEIARNNDELAGKVHELATRLLAARTRAEAALVAEELLRSSFSADQSVLVLFDTPTNGADEFAELADKRFLRRIDRNSPALGPFRTFFESRSPRCGRIRDAQREFLFGEDADDIGSAALVPMGEHCATGFLAIGSRDADYFHPGKSMDFLARLGDLLGSALDVR